jgi:hypothetical protein
MDVGWCLSCVYTLVDVLVTSTSQVLVEWWHITELASNFYSFQKCALKSFLSTAQIRIFSNLHNPWGLLEVNLGISYRVLKIPDVFSNRSCGIRSFTIVSGLIHRQDWMTWELYNTAYIPITISINGKYKIKRHYKVFWHDFLENIIHLNLALFPYQTIIMTIDYVSCLWSLDHYCTDSTKIKAIW